MTQSLNHEFKIGIAALSWINDDMPALGDNYSLEQVLSEMNSLGYVATELGRKFPTEKNELKAILNKYQLTLASKFVGVIFSDPELREKELESFCKWVDFLAEMGCKHVIICEMGGSMHWDRRRLDDKKVVPLSDVEWNSMVQGLNKAGEMCQERGLELVFHPHGATVVEQKEDIDRLMETTDSNLVHLLFDTGHSEYGKYNPLEQLQNHYNRIKYVHLKDVRTSVLSKVQLGELDFREGVLAGVFTVPGDGSINFKPILEELMFRGYKGWLIVEAEQNPEIANPYKYAKIAKNFIDETIHEISNKKSV
ncbi:myo-inosose-2 dehydratase [Halalkalibacter flavus]|uniref:myo-inosose-2 dehydratase n=1 Tax=Halalkalibacter flavus TaxID=3090668 RepID=UPI002FCB3594